MSSSRRCSPDETLNDEDKAFLELLRKLETNERNVDDDSILAPLSQEDDETEVILSQKKNAATIGTQTKNSHPTTTEHNYLDGDDDLLNEFSVNLIDLVPHRNTVPLSIPQMDGGADQSPKKNLFKYPPLNVTITRSTTRPSSDSVVAMLKGKTEITVCAIPPRCNQLSNQPFNTKEEDADTQYDASKKPTSDGSNKLNEGPENNP